jgi:hypothetical protein
MKRDRRIKRVSADLDVLLFPTATERPVRTRCLNCSLPLSLLQPDLDSPDRLLGVCEQCKHWFLIRLIADHSKGLLCRLPDIEFVRELSCEEPSEVPCQ